MRLRPANELTWDNLRWAYGVCYRWGTRIGLPTPHLFIRFARDCRDLRKSHL